MLSHYLFNDEQVQIVAVGDLHGRLDLLERATPYFDKIASESDRHLFEVYLGDYLDRGADPRSVIDRLIQRQTLKDRTVVCLAGNHEQMMLAALDSDSNFLRWLRYGGSSTLLSYGINISNAVRDPKATRKLFISRIPETHLTFLRQLPLYFERGGFFFVHAGVRPGVPLIEQNPQDLLWIREPFLSSQRGFGATVVHGHTPTHLPVFRLNRIGIDTGAYQSGRLTSLLIAADKLALMETTATRHGDGFLKD